MDWFDKYENPQKNKPGKTGNTQKSQNLQKEKKLEVQMTSFLVIKTKTKTK